LLINRRRAEAVIELSGNANCAAVSKRNGVVGVTASGAGGLMLRIIGIRRPEKILRSRKSAAGTKFTFSRGQPQACREVRRLCRRTTTIVQQVKS
jgi:hypothetical protein